MRLSLRQLLQQRLRLFQIARVETLREPPVHGSEQFARLLRLALVAPEACEARGGAKLPRFGLLLTGDRKSTIKIFLRFSRIWLRRLKRDFASYTMQFS